MVPDFNISHRKMSYFDSFLFLGFNLVINLAFKGP